MRTGFPDASALFFMGCGSDQNPLPRRQRELAERYGQSMIFYGLPALRWAEDVEELISAGTRRLVERVRAPAGPSGQSH